MAQSSGAQVDETMAQRQRLTDVAAALTREGVADEVILDAVLEGIRLAREAQETRRHMWD